MSNNLHYFIMIGAQTASGASIKKKKQTKTISELKSKN